MIAAPVARTPAADVLAHWLAVDAGRGRCILRASLLATLPSVAVFALLVEMDVDTLRAPLGALDAAFAAYALLVAPMLETAAMLAVAALAAWVAPRQPLLRILVVGLLGAWAHRLGGDWRQVVRTLWPMLVYASAIVLWLRRSALDAFVVGSAVHAIYNASIFAMGAIGALAAGEG